MMGKDSGRYLKYMTRYHNERLMKRQQPKMPAVFGDVAPECVIPFVRARPGSNKSELIRVMQQAAKTNAELPHNMNRLRQLIDAAEAAGLVRIVRGMCNAWLVYPIEVS